MVGSLEFARNRSDFSGDTWNWYMISIYQLGNLNSGKYISASTTTVSVSSDAQTVSVPGFACNTLGGTAGGGDSFFYLLYDYNYCNLVIQENTTGQQRSGTVTINAEPACDSSSGWITPKTLTITVTQLG